MCNCKNKKIKRPAVGLSKAVKPVVKNPIKGVGNNPRSKLI